MAGITLAQAQAQLDKYLQASLAIADNQSYEIAGRKLTRADLNFVNLSIDSWDRKVKALSGQANGRTRARTVVVGG